jgi:ketosteroid isomerase-like protein
MTPREVFAQMQEKWVHGFGEDVWADDLVVEVPFAPPGRPKRTEGGAKFRRIAEEGRAVLPVTFEACNTIAIHDTANPDVIVVEYELVGTLHATGERHSAQFIGVLTVRDGKAVHWREYQDTAHMAAVLGGQR